MKLSSLITENLHRKREKTKTKKITSVDSGSVSQLVGRMTITVNDEDDDDQ